MSPNELPHIYDQTKSISEENAPSKIFVGNLDPQTSEDQLATLFSTVGEVIDITIYRQSTGTFALVTTTSSEANTAIISHFHAYRLGGKAIVVENTNLSPITEQNLESSLPQEIAKLREALGVGQPISLFIGGVSSKTSEEQLIQLFSQVGTVTKLTLVKPRGRGGKRIAFVEMATDEATQQVIERFNRYIVNDKALSIRLPNIESALKHKSNPI